MMVNSVRLLGGLTCCTQYNWPMSFSPERTHVRAVGREMPSAENTASNSYTLHTFSVLTAPMPGVCVDVSEKVRVRVRLCVRVGEGVLCGCGGVLCD